MNAALIKDVGFQVNDALWQQWGRLAESHAVHLFPVLNFAGNSEVKQLRGTYRTYTDRYGTSHTATPCPLDGAYWEAAIAQRFLALALLAASQPSIAGLLFDIEMYGADVRLYHAPCLCDVCWRQFIENSPDTDLLNLPADQRYQHLRDKNLLRAYEDGQTHQLRSIIHTLSARVHAVAPDLVLGFLMYHDTWFCQGLIQGLGTPASPVLVFSESPYVRGYTPEVEREQTVAKASNDHAASVRYIPGVWLGRFFPNDLVAQLYQLARATDGYWLFSADSLWDAKQEGAYALHDTSAAYRQAIASANAALLSEPDGLSANVPPLFPSSSYDASRNTLITPPTLRTFFQHACARQEFAPVSSPGRIMFRGDNLLHVFQSENQEGRLQITHLILGTYTNTTQYRLFDEQGRSIAEGTLTDNQDVAEIPFSAESEGLMSLLLRTGNNAAYVETQGLALAAEASTTFPFSTTKGAYVYGLYVNRETPHLTLRGYCSGRETAMITIASPDQQVSQSLRIEGFAEIAIPVPEAIRGSHAERLWTVTVQPVTAETFDDVTFSVYNHQYPYLLIRMP